MSVKAVRRVASADKGASSLIRCRGSYRKHLAHGILPADGQWGWLTRGDGDDVSGCCFNETGLLYKRSTCSAGYVKSRYMPDFPAIIGIDLIVS